MWNSLGSVQIWYHVEGGGLEKMGKSVRKCEKKNREGGGAWKSDITLFLHNFPPFLKTKQTKNKKDKKNEISKMENSFFWVFSWKMNYLKFPLNLCNCFFFLFDAFYYIKL